MCAKIFRVRRCAYAARWPAVPLASARSCRALLEVYAVEERRGQEPWKLTSCRTLGEVRRDPVCRRRFVRKSMNCDEADARPLHVSILHAAAHLTSRCLLASISSPSPRRTRLFSTKAQTCRLRTTLRRLHSQRPRRYHLRCRLRLRRPRRLRRCRRQRRRHHHRRPHRRPTPQPTWSQRQPRRPSPRRLRK